MREEKQEREREERKRSTETNEDPTFHLLTHSGESYLAVGAGLLEDSVMTGKRDNVIFKTKCI